MVMASQQGIGRNADGVDARRLAVMLMASPQEGWP